MEDVSFLFVETLVSFMHARSRTQRGRMKVEIVRKLTILLKEYGDISF